MPTETQRKFNFQATREFIQAVVEYCYDGRKSALCKMQSRLMQLWLAELSPSAMDKAEKLVKMLIDEYNKGEPMLYYQVEPYLSIFISYARPSIVDN
jgi:hypothetical protein